MDFLTAIKGRMVDVKSWSFLNLLSLKSEYDGIIASSATGTTQSAGDNSTKIATTAYADRARVHQIVSTTTTSATSGTTVMPYDNTIPQNTEGDEYMTRAITPKSATSTLIIDVTINLATSASFYVGIALFQDSTANALAAITFTPQGGAILQSNSFRHVMTSGTTSSTTFKVRAGGTAGTTYFNSTGALPGGIYGGVFSSNITITEVLP